MAAMCRRSLQLATLFQDQLAGDCGQFLIDVGGLTR